jgi:hypothetical protein
LQSPERWVSDSHVGYWPIVLKKSKMLLQQNSRESELIADFD